MRLLKAVGVVIICLSTVWAKFDPCRFNFGQKLDTGNFDKVDIIAQYTWKGTGLESDIVNMLRTCKNNNKTPALYMYIIAKSSGLGDCNTGGGLCSEGANYIRNNKNKIKDIYKNYATGIRDAFGTADPIILFMEPDYYQYAQPGSQNGNPLSFQEAGTFIGECIDIMKAELPNALVSLDVSPWVEDQGTTTSWFSALPLSKVNYINTSGGVSKANSSLIKNENKLTWQRVHDVTKKCIFADAGYGVGGGGTGHDNDWDNVSNINNRIRDGVIGVVQFSPKSDWNNTLSSISGQLDKPICPCTGIVKTVYSLSLDIGVGGRVTRSPDATTYDSGATVTLTAIANAGYKFKEWGGDASGTSTTLTVKMDKDKSITATFVDPNAKPTYSLTITTKGSGVVTVTPEKAQYDSGTTVTLSTGTVNGATFTGWSGDLSGSNPAATLVMNSNKSVTATFSGSDIVLPENLVKNGDFSNGDDNWTFGAYESASAEGSVEGGAFAVSTQSAGTEEWHIQLYQEGIALTKGEKYDFVFTASAQSPTQIIANVGMASGDYTSYSQAKKINLTTEPQKFTISFTMREASTTDARLEFNSGVSSGSWEIDDISLSKQLVIGVTAPAPFITKAGGALPVASDARATVSWYDFHGRLLGQQSGTYLDCVNHQMRIFPGSCITVLEVGKQKIVRRNVSLSR